MLGPDGIVWPPFNKDKSLIVICTIRHYLSFPRWWFWKKCVFGIMMIGLFSFTTSCYKDESVEAPVKQNTPSEDELDILIQENSASQYFNFRSHNMFHYD